MQQKTALLFGATGLIGKNLLEELVDAEQYEKVKVFSRRNIHYDHPRVELHVIDFNRLDQSAHLIKGDDLFCCLGTTIKNAGSKEATRLVDYDYPVKIAEIAEKNGVKRYLVVSSIGANSKASVFYLRSKGDMEEAVRKMKFKSKHSLRPSLLVGKREENRTAEKLSYCLMKPFAWLMVGRLKRYRPIHGKTVAKAMLYLAGNEHKDFIIQSDKITELAKK